jgi:AraC-like DNA-binding protein
MRSEFKIGIKQPRKRSLAAVSKHIKKEPVVRQYLMLAYQIKQYLEENPNKTASAIASWLGYSPSRVSQLLNLLSLSPQIQEEILLSEDSKIYSIPEHKIRGITKEKDFERQGEMWRDLKLQ